MEKHQEIIEVLNELIEINISRLEGYQKATTDVFDEDLKVLFEGMVNESTLFENQIADFVISLGGEPAKDCTFVGKIHQIWIDFKAAVSANNRHAILSSCEFGDEQAILAYDAILEIDEVQKMPELQRFLSGQRQAIDESLKIIRSLLHATHNADAELETLRNQEN